MVGKDVITLERPDVSKAPLPDHHGSHTPLLDLPAEASPRGSMDAVIVPAARPTQSLETAVGLAKSLDATCLALCSKHADAAEAAALGKQNETDVVAVPTTSLHNVHPTFTTDSMLHDAGIGKDVDIALKRNLGLVIARMSSWKRVFFLDDDVMDVNADDVAAAAGLLHEYDAVGLENNGFPDNSVVCHANREVSPLGAQDQFISTMALALTVGTQSFFPNIYNEDWLFFLGDLPAGQWRPRLAATGKAVQNEFDPFADPERARREEFGDTIAEGLFWLLDQKRSLERADLEHWEFFLPRRRAFIDHILDRSHTAWAHDPGGLTSRVAALEAAQEQNRSLTPEFCAAYVDAWRADLRTWRSFVADLEMPPEPSVTGALEQLGLTPHTYTSR